MAASRWAVKKQEHLEVLSMQLVQSLLFPASKQVDDDEAEAHDEVE